MFPELYVPPPDNQDPIVDYDKRAVLASLVIIVIGWVLMFAVFWNDPISTVTCQ